MKRFQRTLTATVAATALLGSLAFSANAQQQPAPQTPTATAAPAPHAHGHRAEKKDFAKAHAERAERLKTLLQLQPNQQAAFDQYVKATTPEPRNKADKEQRADLRKLTTPERLDLAQKLRKERTAKAEQREQATRSFYSSLNASQKKVFDEVSARGHGKHKAGPHKHGDAKRGHSHGHATQPGVQATPAV